MRNRRLFVFIIGLEILLQNMANNDNSKLGSDYSELCSIDHHEVGILYCFHLVFKTAFVFSSA